MGMPPFWWSPWPSRTKRYGRFPRRSSARPRNESRCAEPPMSEDKKRMIDLATLAIDAHGGLDRWRELKTMSARLLQGGVLWQLKRQDKVLRDVHLTVDLRKEWTSHWPF